MAVNKKVTRETYLATVKRYRTTINNEIAKKLGVHRSNIGRFLNKNPELKAEAEKLLKDIDRIQFKETSVMDVEVFSRIPDVAEWLGILERKNMKPKGVRSRAFALMRVCNAIGVHPSKLNIDNVADNVNRWKIAQSKHDKLSKDKKKEWIKANGMPYPRGCSYNNVRSAIRSYFTIMMGITPDVLTIKGIGAEHSEGFAKSARERISPDERVEIIDSMRQAVIEIFTEEDINLEEYPIDDFVIEMYGVCFFMYYTATRIDASINATLNDKQNVFKTGYYEIHITDKGRGSRIDWQKRLIDNGYELMSAYIQERFGISQDAQPKMLKSFDSYLFPLLQKNYSLETKVMKRVQEITNSWKIVQVNHLWRHTFAQDWLHAMEGNYEVGAEIGGWKDIGTMKRCYGAVSEHIIQRGLRKAMGLPVEEEDFELRYAPEEHDVFILNMIKSRGAESGRVVS